MNARLLSSFCILALLIMTEACIEKTEGCLDPNALNLDVTADVNANCSYPFLKFSFVQKWDEQVFRLNSRYALSTGDTLVVTALRSYISDVSLGGSQDLVVFDSIRRTDLDFIRDDLAIFNPSSLLIEMGHVNKFATYDSVSFSLGYDAKWIEVDTNYINDVETSHPWMEDNMRTELDERYTVRLGYKLINQDTISRIISSIGPKTMAMTKIGNFTTAQANHAVVKMLIDYENVFEGIDLREGTNDEIAEGVWRNLIDALSLNF